MQTSIPSREGLAAYIMVMRPIIYPSKEEIDAMNHAELGELIGVLLRLIKERQESLGQLQTTGPALGLSEIALKKIGDRLVANEEIEKQLTAQKGELAALASMDAEIPVVDEVEASVHKVQSIVEGDKVDSANSNVTDALVANFSVHHDIDGPSGEADPAEDYEFISNVDGSEENGIAQRGWRNVFRR
ncbi:hypothetical protein P154DRAFT_529881 [Amniculicola lignicola CBS 123094]|uniref:Uncharacterized protein n=1 Tax=Amniculicola lignicola CBS 123094 TaxID=1392246 RepID=A0A6A5X1Z2_9PLEO|nr:hypothetical protein P154DRAFT_529881 [Amniculicola lignicola CBS 123094]